MRAGAAMGTRIPPRASGLLASHWRHRPLTPNFPRHDRSRNVVRPGEDGEGAGDRAAARSARFRLGGAAAAARVSGSAPTRRASLGLAFAIIGAAALVRLVLAAHLPPPADETYYWMWSRRLAAGYFDHPPVIALGIRAGTALLGVSAFAIRVVPVLMGFGAAVCAILLARRLGGDTAGVRAALVFSLMPLAAAGLVLATPDTPLLLSVAATLLALDHAVAEPEGSRRALLWWLAAGAALGFGFLSKYNAALIPLAVFLALLLDPVLRRQLATPGPYVAALVALLLFVPVVVWNARHDWVSFAFQLSHGLRANHGAALQREGDLLGGQLGLVTPILFVLFVIAVGRSLGRGAPRERLLAVTAAAIFLFFCASALRGRVEANWQAASYVPATVLAASLPGGRWWRRWFTAGCALAAAVTLLVYVQSWVPVLPLPAGNDPTARGAGWDTVATRAAAIADSLRRAGAPHAWIAGNRYQEASELAFHDPAHPDTFSLNLFSRPNQYDLWPSFAQRARTGDALVLALLPVAPGKRDRVIDALRPHFARVAAADTVVLRRDGQPLGERVLWVLEGWRGTWPGATLAR